MNRQKSGESSDVVIKDHPRSQGQLEHKILWPFSQKSLAWVLSCVTF